MKAKERSMGKIALLGAAGAVGQSIADALQRQGTEYRAIGRTAAALEKSFGADPLAEIKTWNPDDPESVREALTGIETAVYLVGVNYWQFELHPRLMQRTIDGAVVAGVKRILLIGTVYPYGLPQTNMVGEDHPRKPHTFKGKMRKEQEDLLFAARKAGRIEACELRLPDFYGPHVDKSFLWSAFQAAKNGTRAQLVGPIDQPHQYVFVPDVGPIVTSLLSKEEAWGQVWHFAGSGIITQRDFVGKIFAAVGKKPRMIVAGKTMLRVMGLFNPILRELAEMHYLQTDPVLMDDSRLGQLLGKLKRTDFDLGVRETLESMEG
jgi:nucleoside-diphosphate-sugar epimerase